MSSSVRSAAEPFVPLGMTASPSAMRFGLHSHETAHHAVANGWHTAPLVAAALIYQGSQWQGGGQYGGGPFPDGFRQDSWGFQQAIQRHFLASNGRVFPQEFTSLPHGSTSAEVLLGDAPDESGVNDEVQWQVAIGQSAAFAEWSEGKGEDLESCGGGVPGSTEVSSVPLSNHQPHRPVEGKEAAQKNARKDIASPMAHNVWGSSPPKVDVKIDFSFQNSGTMTGQRGNGVLEPGQEVVLSSKMTSTHPDSRKPLLDTEQKATKHKSKLSPEVPEFVPRPAVAQSAPSRHIALPLASSTQRLSPEVPEFIPRSFASVQATQGTAMTYHNAGTGTWFQGPTMTTTSASSLSSTSPSFTPSSVAAVPHNESSILVVEAMSPVLVSSRPTSRRTPALSYTSPSFTPSVATASKQLWAREGDESTTGGTSSSAKLSSQRSVSYTAGTDMGEKFAGQRPLAARDAVQSSVASKDTSRLSPTAPAFTPGTGQVQETSNLVGIEGDKIKVQSVVYGGPQRGTSLATEVESRLSHLAPNALHVASDPGSAEAILASGLSPTAPAFTPGGFLPRSRQKSFSGSPPLDGGSKAQKVKEGDSSLCPSEQELRVLVNLMGELGSESSTEGAPEQRNAAVLSTEEQQTRGVERLQLALLQHLACQGLYQNPAGVNLPPEDLFYTVADGKQTKLEGEDPQLLEKVYGSNCKHHTFSRGRDREDEPNHDADEARTLTCAPVAGLPSSSSFSAERGLVARTDHSRTLERSSSVPSVPGKDADSALGAGEEEAVTAEVTRVTLGNHGKPQLSASAKEFIPCKAPGESTRSSSNSNTSSSSGSSDCGQELFGFFDSSSDVSSLAAVLGSSCLVRKPCSRFFPAPDHSTEGEVSAGGDVSAEGEASAEAEVSAESHAPSATSTASCPQTSSPASSSLIVRECSHAEASAPSSANAPSETGTALSTSSLLSPGLMHLSLSDASLLPWTLALLSSMRASAPLELMPSPGKPWLCTAAPEAAGAASMGSLRMDSRECASWSGGGFPSLSEEFLRHESGEAEGLGQRGPPLPAISLVRLADLILSADAEPAGASPRFQELAEVGLLLPPDLLEQTSLESNEGVLLATDPMPNSSERDVG